MYLYILYKFEWYGDTAISRNPKWKHFSFSYLIYFGFIGYCGIIISIVRSQSKW